MADDPFYTRSPWARIFTSYLNSIEEHTLHAISKELARSES